MQTTENNTAWTLIFIAWLIAASSTMTSLFFSEIMHLEPCILCWYQRICIFPLAIILLMGLYPLRQDVIKYALPFAVIGLGFTLYHIALFYGFIPEGLKPCTQGVPCDDDSMVLFGFLPIPLLSLGAFSAIIVLLLMAKSRITS
ncbi:MAG TPA: disulfide bond formation protein B [Ghiorsea sp.]|nr:disulfide bond formation protein B [Ghiorsea sp.]HIP06317.1 disulfide bond formation protein B [Mariprofundaceae bacterium]